ncbi:MAG: YqgE/AlgH family protein [Parvularcula sp.]
MAQTRLIMSPSTHQFSADNAGLTGRLLVAMPQMTGSLFDRSVILICQHDQEHAFGLILNRRMDGIQARDAVDRIGIEPGVTAGDHPLYIGGPVAPRSGFILHTLDYMSEETQIVPGGFGVTTNRKAFERLKGDQVSPKSSKLFAGYSGWSAGQLEDELRRGLWLDGEARPDLVFGESPEDLWQRTLNHLGLTEAVLWSMSSSASQGDRQPLN